MIMNGESGVNLKGDRCDNAKSLPVHSPNSRMTVDNLRKDPNQELPSYKSGRSLVATLNTVLCVDFLWVTPLCSSNTAVD